MLSRPLLMMACFLFGVGAGAIGSYASAQEIQTDPIEQWTKFKIQALRSAGPPVEQQKVVRELVLKLGPEKAQDELLQSGLPFTGDSHLVIHEVGTAILERYGLEGIAHCRPYFLGACYHGFLIEVIGKRGSQIISDVWTQCKRAGPAIIPQCAHAVGHGLLAWKNNSIRDALAACDSVATEVDQFEPLHCYDGVFMENVWGLHQQEHSAQHQHGAPHLSIASDLEYPCNDPQLDARHLQACWGNQVSLLYRAFQGDLAKIGEKCLSLANSVSKESCLNGLARQIQPMTQGNADEAFRLCATAFPAPWQNYCLAVIAESNFAMGDQKSAPFQICRRIEASGRQECYERLISVIALYAGRDWDRVVDSCGRIADIQYADACSNRFGQILREDVARRVATEQQSSGEDRSADPFQQAQIPGPGPVRPPYPYPDPYRPPYEYPYPYPYPYPTPYPDPYLYPTPYRTPYRTPPN